MTEISGIKTFVDCELEGRSNTYNFRKNPSQTTVANFWFDLSSSPGYPLPRYWFGDALVATPISQSTDGGFFHGSAVSPGKKYLKESSIMATAATALAMPMILLDYLLYYPLIDESTTDAQIMDNTQTLPRYTDGEGVQMMAISIASRTGGQQFYVTYTNQDGTTGRTSKTVTMNTVTILNNIVTSHSATSAASCFFIPLQEGDTGVRAVESVTMLGTDVGLFSLMLVRPLAYTQVYEVTAASEYQYLNSSVSIPEIKDDAYLNFICLPKGSLAATGLIISLKNIFTN